MMILLVIDMTHYTYSIQTDDSSLKEEKILLSEVEPLLQ